VKLMSKVDKILGIISMLLFAALIIVVVIQILSRYFPYDVIWTEELSRYLFVYSMVTAAPLALRRNEFITVDILIEALPEKGQRIYESIIAGAIAIFSLVLFIYSLTFINLGLDFYSPTLGFLMAYAYAAIPLLAILLFVYSITYIVDRYQNNAQGKEVDDI
jgi:TRAP-type C4-dicarboxylate transport system permease small subunit